MKKNQGEISNRIIQGEINKFQGRFLSYDEIEFRETLKRILKAKKG